MAKAWLVSLWVIFAFAAPLWAEERNSCVSCHGAVEDVSYVEHNFADWSSSIHAKAGVACQTCHGGNAGVLEKDAAHKGVLSSTDPKSPVYFTQVPETCGMCHPAELKAFEKSAHHKELQRSGRGPNCVTCHGSMANHVMAPRELEMTCTLCHRRPTKAYATLLSLNNASAALKRLKDALDKGPTGTTGPQEKAYADAEKTYQAALADWHTFKMDAVLRAAQEVTGKSTGALNEIRLKRRQNHGQ